MIYLNTHSVTTVTVNGTTCTEFQFTNNQTEETFSIDLWAVGINPLGKRKQLTFLLQWTNTTTDMGATVEDGVNCIRVPQGEYNYTLGDVCGIMKLTETNGGGSVYQSDDINTVYNG